MCNIKENRENIKNLLEKGNLKEKENLEKRKNESLKFDEWISFFLIPLNISPRFLPTKDFNDIEEERYSKFGFEKKKRQALIARLFGILFYILIIWTLVKYI